MDRILMECIPALRAGSENTELEKPLQSHGQSSEIHCLEGRLLSDMWL